MKEKITLKENVVSKIISKSQKNVTKMDSNDIKKASILLVRKLYMLMQNLGPLPDSVCLNMKLSYYDDGESQLFSCSFMHIYTTFMQYNALNPTHTGQEHQFILTSNKINLCDFDLSGIYFYLRVCIFMCSYVFTCLSVTPHDYQPPGFKEGESMLVFQKEPVNLTMGEVITPFHTLKVDVTTEKERLEKVQVELYGDMVQSSF